MKKLHTRQKRKLGIASTKSGKELTKKRKKRPKTFKTEEAAHKWAETHGFVKGKYELIKVKKGKKFQAKAI